MRSLAAHVLVLPILKRLSLMFAQIPSSTCKSRRSAPLQSCSIASSLESRVPPKAAPDSSPSSKGFLASEHCCQEHEFAIEDIKDCPVSVADEMVALAAVLRCTGPKGGKGPGKGPAKGQAKGVTCKPVCSRVFCMHRS